MKKYEVTLRMTGWTDRVITVSGLLANDEFQARSVALDQLKLPAHWEVDHVTEVVKV